MHKQKATTGYKFVKSNYKKSEEIPENWEKDSLKNCLVLLKDGTHNPPERVKDGIQLIAAENIHDGMIDFKVNPSYISESDYNESHKKYSIQKSDLFLTIVGTIGRVALVNTDKKFTIQRSVAIFRFIKNLVPEFFYYVFQTRYYQLQLIIRSNSTTRPGVYLGELGKTFVFYPTNTSEQQKIASILSYVDNLIRNTNQQIEQTKLLKNGLLNTLMKKGIGHSKFKTVLNFFKKEFEIPSSWDYVPFYNVVKVNSKTSVSSNELKYVPMDAVNVDSPNIDYFETRKVDAVNNLLKFKQNDVLFARITPSTENGKTAFVEKFSGVGCASTELTVLRPGAKVFPFYLYYYVKSHRVRQFAISQMLGTTNRQRVPEYVFKKDLKFDLPPLPEQKQIVKILSNLDSLIQKQKQIKLNFKNHKKWLMQNLLTGKIRVKF